MNRPIRIAIVDDSLFVRKVLVRIFEHEEGIEIAGTAESGEQLLDNLENWRPDAVTLDVAMPGMGGLATLDRILEWKQIPVVILSGHGRREAPLALEALRRGAVDFVDKDEISLVDFESLRTVLMPRIRGAIAGRPSPQPPPPAVEAPAPILWRGKADLVVLGASTGGPPAVEDILAGLGGPLPVPMLIVQHMPPGFTSAFAERLNARLPMRVKEASHNEVLLPGGVYIAAGGMHLRVRKEGARLHVVLGHYPETPHRPSVDVLFRSAVPLAPRVIAILLTGMGEDGARGMLELHAANAHTIAQDEATSVVWGMPRVAVQLGGVSEQLPREDIAPRLRQMLDGNTQR